MTKIIKAQIRILEATSNAVVAINKGIDKVQRVLNTGLDKAQVAVVNYLNQRIDRLADEHLRQAAAVTAAPYKQAELLREQCDALTAEYLEEGERRSSAFAAASAALLAKQVACTSPEALHKARSEADAIYKARVELLARKQ